MRRITAVLTLIALMLTAMNVAVAAYGAKPASGYVLDESDILANETESAVNRASAELYAKNGAAVYVICTDGKESAATTAKNVFAEWELSPRTVLLALSPLSFDYYAIAGGDLAETLSTESLKNILSQTVEPSFSTADNDGAAEGFVKAVCERLSLLAAEPEDAGVGFGGVLLRVLLVLLVLAVIFIIVIFAIRTVNVNRAKKRRLRRRIR